MIVLFTDFGLTGPYTGQMKAVLAQTAPTVPVIDLFADAPAENPQAAAYLLAAYAPWFPFGTVFLAVVDPGVGGDRAPLLVDADGRWYVGPDNGLFEPLMRRSAMARPFEITWRPSLLSASFHGRDLFAPVAARMAAGQAPQTMAQPTTPRRYPDWPDELSQVIYIDQYGNAMTGVRAAALAGNETLIAGGRALTHARTFSDVPPGHPFWYENSTGLVEIAINQGRADTELNLHLGSEIVLRPTVGAGAAQ